MQRSTWGLLVTAVALGGAVYVFQQHSQIESTVAQSIFAFEDEAIQELTISQPEQTLSFERTDNEPYSWQMKQPEDVPASDAAVSFLLDLLTEKESDRAFTITAAQKSEYGLANPTAEIEIKLEDQEHRLILGKPSFDNQFIYAQKDPSRQSNGEFTVILVPIEFRYAIERELEEWQQTSEIE